MSVQIYQSAISENFVIDYIPGKQVTVLPHPGCTGTISVHLTDDTVETLEMTLQHDGESCPIHEGR